MPSFDRVRPVMDLGRTIPNSAHPQPNRGVVADDSGKVPPAAAGVPIGVPLPFFGTVAPPGYILFDGSIVKRHNIPKLSQHIIENTAIDQTGAGADEVVLPAMAGMFLRGADGEEPGDTGGAEDSALPDITTTVTVDDATLATTGIDTVAGATSLVTDITHTHTATAESSYDTASVGIVPPYLACNFIGVAA